ncbi:MAG: SDR family NAD(P)-dependent oxidoreductase [Acidimicrobiales bacterium]
MGRRALRPGRRNGRDDGAASLPLTVAITGASSGVGAATAAALARPGARIALLARRGDALEAVAAEVRAAGAEADVMVVDLRDHAAAQETARAVVRRFGPPDVVVANAGHSIARPVLDCVDRFDTFERTVGLNYLGAVAFLLPCLEAMAARGRGHVVGVTTVNARIPVPGFSAYVASKAALDAWLRAAGPELRRAGIATSIVELPLVATAMSAPVYGPDPRFALTADEAAAWIVRAIDTRRPTIAPWWARPAEVAVAAAPTVSARLLAVGSLRAARRAARPAGAPSAAPGPGGEGHRQ